MFYNFVIEIFYLKSIRGQHICFKFSNYEIQFFFKKIHNTLDRDMLYTKFMVLEKIWNFLVEFFILECL